MWGKVIHDACADFAHEMGGTPMPRNCGRGLTNTKSSPTSAASCASERKNVMTIEERQAAQDNARSVQVGGDHYSKLAIQPFDYITANGIGFAEGCCIKYLTRWRDKGGVQDLRKARHFIDMLIEREVGKWG
jgi:hypothetical protein